MSMRQILALVGLVLFCSCESILPRVDNANDCVLNESLCPEQELICDSVTRVCHRGDGSCDTAVDCLMADRAQSTSGQCIPCSADNQCVAWSTQRNQTPPLNFCGSGRCQECTRNFDCKDISRPTCDVAQGRCR